MTNFLMVTLLPFTVISCSFLPASKDQFDRDYYNSAESEFPLCETKDELIPHIHCFLYYTCNNSIPTLNICDHSMYFNRKTGKCDKKDNVEDCVEGVRILPGTSFPSSLKNIFRVVTSAPFLDEEDFEDKADYTEPGTAQLRMPRTERSNTIESFEEATQIILPEFMQVRTTTTTQMTPVVEEVTPRSERTKADSPGFGKKKEKNKSKVKTTTTTTESSIATPMPVIDPLPSKTLPVTMSSNETVGDGCTPAKIVIHHYPGPCKAEFTCSDGSSFLIEHCISNLIWKPKHFDMII
ncbi:unnamed protein product [Allacma fusca]|uniref:Chitin-binding type-2 domain-containing protein n=1 Tax=Allacma fusca TaxID=39272 RepID=A0A8J2LFX0_9HEXA|nr:unnamed protein product [Allacma fusca]